jgi:hypothetical protein
MLRYQESQGEVARGNVARRAQTIVDTLGWDPECALEQSWGFIATELHEPEDAWAPALVLRKLGGDLARLDSWLRGLPTDARTFAEQGLEAS